MNQPSEDVVLEYQKEAKRQATLASERRMELGESFYGYKDGSTDNLKFQTMMSKSKTWNDPIFSHTLNASFICGSTYGLYFFFRNPVKNKMYHVFEMFRRTCMGTAASMIPISLFAMWRKRGMETQQAAKLKEQNDKLRKQYIQKGGQPMESPPYDGYVGPK
eukprot:TRINITY_DN15837_c0_g1_i1.p1 TRINITY_DN15837_c0_g1~~TRINITY_DN15837_c0_g1_i1.p1  ORF type:complete len:162 (+),score=19.56 TRINITY_DN15837_c0_g1_i1:42-527(+)